MTAQAIRRFLSLKDRRGVAAIEYALILPVFLTLVFGIIDISRLMWFQISIQRATAIAARCGAVASSSCISDAQIGSTAAISAPGIKLKASEFTVVRGTCGVKVNAAVPFTFISAFVGLPARTLKASYCHPLTQ